MPTEHPPPTPPAGQARDVTELTAQIAATEDHLAALRATRDAQVREEHQDGASKYALAKRWQVNENTITRILAR